MNLVFQALVLLVLLLPGLIFRWAYMQGGWRYPLGQLGPVAEQIPRSLVHAAWLNAVWAALVRGLTHLAPQWTRPVDFQAAVYWITNNFGNDQVEFPRAVRSLTASPLHVLAYFLGLFALAWVAGRAANGLVRGLRLDRRYQWLRFDNEWHYILRGEVLDFSDYKRSAGPSRMPFKDRQATIVVAIVETKSASFLYAGTLIDYFFDSAGELDRLLLAGALRRPISQDDPSSGDERTYEQAGRWYPIKGDYLILHARDIKTLNVDYVTDKVVTIAQSTDMDLGVSTGEVDQEESEPGEEPQSRSVSNH